MSSINNRKDDKVTQRENDKRIRMNGTNVSAADVWF